MKFANNAKVEMNLSTVALTSIWLHRIDCSSVAICVCAGTKKWVDV